MSDYSNQITLTTESSEFDMNDDFGELLQKNNQLNLENEELAKRLRDFEYTKDSRISELQIEIDKLTETNQSLEDLVKSLKKGSEKPVQESESVESRLENKKMLADLQSKNLILSNAEQNLKRKNHELTMEISNLKLANEKLNMKMERDQDETHHHTEDIGDDMTKEELKNITHELINELEDLKKEKHEMEEKALNALTEKEMEILKLTQLIEDQKNSHNVELHKLILEIQDFNNVVEFLGITKKKLEEELSYSIQAQEKNQLKSKAFEVEFKNIRQELEQKESNFNEERERIYKDFDTQEHSHKIKIFEMEQEIIKLKNEIGAKDKSKEELTDELKERNDLSIELENYKNLIKALEEKKDKNEFTLNEKLSCLKRDILEYEKTVKKLKDDKSNFENHIADLEKSYMKKLSDCSETSQIQLLNKESEIKNLKKKIELLEKEKEAYLSDRESYKIKADKSKQEYLDLSDQVKNMKENYSNEVKKLEEKLLIQEKKAGFEKKRLSEQVSQLKVQTPRGSIDHSHLHEYEDNKQYQRRISLKDMLGDENTADKIEELKTEISNLHDQVNESKAKIRDMTKQINEMDLIKKENIQVKTEIKEIREMYEEQIEDLQKKMLEANTDLQKQKRKLTNPAINIDQSIKNTLSSLTESRIEKEAEVKYLNDKIRIMEKEQEKLKELRDKDINYYKKEVMYAEDMAVKAKVELASLAYEKDTDILKYKNMAKKYATKLKAIKINLGLGNSKETPPKGLVKSSTAKSPERKSKASTSMNLKFI